MTKEELITAIEQYAAASGISEATVTGRAVGNSRLYARMQAGGSCTMDVAERLVLFMKERADKFRPSKKVPSELVMCSQSAASAAPSNVCNHVEIPDGC